ncbi:hypothetical protein BDZ89DRAFT_1075481 [Hymenopellis radicata]|nr:hypothetical protein BDZ89DRAFT_1075481 [Hymenopellis radicata]
MPKLAHRHNAERPPLSSLCRRIHTSSPTHSLIDNSPLQKMLRGAIARMWRTSNIWADSFLARFTPRAWEYLRFLVLRSVREYTLLGHLMVGSIVQTPVTKTSGCNHMTCMSPGCNTSVLSLSRQLTSPDIFVIDAAATSFNPRCVDSTP